MRINLFHTAPQVCRTKEVAFLKPSHPVWLASSTLSQPSKPPCFKTESTSFIGDTPVPTSTGSKEFGARISNTCTVTTLSLTTLSNAIGSSPRTKGFAVSKQTFREVSVKFQNISRLGKVPVLPGSPFGMILVC